MKAGAAPSTRRIGALSVMAAAIADADNLLEVLGLIADETRRGLGADEVAISRYEPEADLLRVLAVSGDMEPGQERYPTAEVYPAAEIPTILARLRRGEGYVAAVDSPVLDPGERESLRLSGKESHVGVPIVVGGTLWGELWAGTAHGTPRFGDDDVDLVRAVAGYVAIGVSRMALLERLEALAHRDSLTGLFNHRKYHQALDRMIAPDRSPFAVMTIDLDGFKAVNDRSGHAAGDRVLQAVASAVLASCRGSDHAYRVGGDELAVILPLAHLAAATAAATRLSAAIAEANLGISVSCGVAAWPDDGRGKDELLTRADMRLYDAKHRREPSSGDAADAPLRQVALDA
jgi:diguanylate cyclase (GGDEF)-like protein